MKLAHSRLKLPLVGLALASVGGLAGCASTAQLSPAATSDITDAYQVLCGPAAPATVSGLVGVAQATEAALPATAQSIVATGLQICAAGVPTNEIVAGVDIFDLLVEVEGLTTTKVSARTKAHIHALAARHGA